LHSLVDERRRASQPAEPLDSFPVGLEERSQSLRGVYGVLGGFANASTRTLCSKS